MAHIAVCTVIKNLAPLLVHEAELLSNVHKEFSSIKAELESIKFFLKDTDLRAETGDESAKIWVKQVRDVAFQIEDAIDEYILHLAKQHQQRGFFHKVAHSVTKLKARHEIASQIQDIKTIIREIKERAKRYGFSTLKQGTSSNTEDSVWHDPRVASLFIEEDEVVGIEPYKNDMIRRLVAHKSKQVLISIVGMAGVGKTTLARKVYGNQLVSRNFDCCGWIPVSQSYKTEELLRTMLRQFYESRGEFPPMEIDTMDQTSLIIKLRDYLNQKRYIIVFDDIWRTSFWGFIRHTLPKNGKDSRVIITTRSEEVATFCKCSSVDHVHKLLPLPEEKAWELFCKKAFQWDFGGKCPPELEKVSREVVKKCEGLPLAIVAIGGLLCTKNKVVAEWQKFYQSLGSELERKPELASITKIVLLSYHDLPYYLKSCFLYLGIIPEDYSISCGRLIRLWIAEGFVEGQKGKILEEVAEEYLTELIHRSLIQVSSSKFDGRVTKCRVHDVVREIILSKSKELSFCQVLAEDNIGFNDKTRRLSAHKGYNMDKVLEGTNKSQIRSVFLFEVDQLPKKPLMRTLAKNLKLLKVLDMTDAPLDQLHEEVGNLFHLEYLSVRRTKVRVIPKSIGNLHNLKTLDLKYALVHKLPNEINTLCKLRHLLAFSVDYENVHSLGYVRGVTIQQGIGRLEELQKLWFVEANENGLSLIKELENLKQLRKLGIAKLKTEYGRALGTTIEKMKHLNVLKVWAISKDEILDLSSISSPPESLQRLSLSGHLEKLPDWIPELQNLVELRLNWSGLTNDPLKALQALPNLLTLYFNEGYDGEQLYFDVGGFQKLKLLSLRCLKMNSLIIEEGALPLLEELRIGPSLQLKEVPPGIHHLRKLTILTFLDMPTEFFCRMQPDKGQDCWIVEHVSTVKFILAFGRVNFEVYSPWEFNYANESKRITEVQDGSQS